MNISDRAVSSPCSFNPSASLQQQQGSTLLSAVVIILIVGIMATGSIDLSHQSEKSAGTAIQRSRAFQAADGGSAIAQQRAMNFVDTRAFADNTASEGVFSRGNTQRQWWREETYTGEQIAPDDTVLGVAKSPRFVIEELGLFVSNGDSGVSNLDLGSGSYGSATRGGRQVVFYRIESHGTGSFDGVRSVIESVVAFDY